MPVQICPGCGNDHDPEYHDTGVLRRPGALVQAWADLERAALFDPVLSQTVTLVRQGVPREEALIACALALAAVNKRLLDEGARLLRESRASGSGASA